MDCLEFFTNDFMILTAGNQICLGMIMKFISNQKISIDFPSQRVVAKFHHFFPLDNDCFSNIHFFL